MTTATRTFLVTGATGKQGGAVVRALLAATTTATATTTTNTDSTLSSSSSPATSGDIRILALTRSIASGSAKALASLDPRITLVQGSIEQPEAVFSSVARAAATAADAAAAAADVAGAKERGAGAGLSSPLPPPLDGVFFVQVNSDVEEVQGRAFVEAAHAAGVRHFVYASGDRGGAHKSAIDPTAVKNFAAKFVVEKVVETLAAKDRLSSPAAAAGAAGATTRDDGEQTRMTYTILRPTTFFDNVTPDVHGAGFARMWEQLGPDKPLQMVGCRDIGYFAAQALLQCSSSSSPSSSSSSSSSSEYRNTAISLAGDQLTQPQAARIFKEVVGADMPIAPCIIGNAVKYFKKDSVGDMFRWFADVGYGASVDECNRLRRRGSGGGGGGGDGMMDWRAWLLEESPFVKR